VLDACLRDTRRTHLLGADGRYVAPPASPDGAIFDAQEALLEWYQADARAAE